LRLVFVHGRAQEGKDPSELQRTWEDAWERGLAHMSLQRPHKLEVRFPFYGDILDRLLQELQTPPPGVSKGAPPADAALLGALALEYAAGLSIPDEVLHEALEPGAPKQKGPENWAWVQAILRVLDGPLGSHALARFLKDVWAYLTFPAVHRQIDALVSRELEAGAIVVGHSLGSVITYRCLRASGAPRARLYLTLGSPLAVRTIKSKLVPLQPPAADAWFDARDPRDAVSLYPVDPTTFPVTRPSIEHWEGVTNHTDNRHGIDGYLDDPIVAEQLHRALVRG
jgi:hypothetical protein